jgi:hypothetical protein
VQSSVGGLKIGHKINVDLSRNGKQWKTKIEIEDDRSKDLKFVGFKLLRCMFCIDKRCLDCPPCYMLIDVGSTYVHHHGAPKGFHSSAGEIQATGAKYDPAPSNSHQFCSIVTVPFQIIKRIGGLSLSGWWFYPS